MLAQNVQIANAKKRQKTVKGRSLYYGMPMREFRFVSHIPLTRQGIGKGCETNVGA
jgi:hypothetical protein